MTKSGKFTVKFLYNALELDNFRSFPVREIWLSWDNLELAFCVGGSVGHVQRREWSLADMCYFCHLHEESIDHLLLHREKTRVLWELLFALFRVSWVLPLLVRETLLG